MADQPAPELQPAPTDAKQWQGLCKLAFNNRHHPDDWQELQAKHLQMDERLVSTAVELVAGVVEDGVRRWDWLPPPNDAELAEPSAWVAQRLAARRAEQDEAERDRRLRQEDGPRVRAVGSNWHRRNKLELLDHKSPHYINARDGGVSNKQITIIANDIVEQRGGRREPRSFDENWKIVMDRANEQQPEEAA